MKRFLCIFLAVFLCGCTYVSLPTAPLSPESTTLQTEPQILATQPQESTAQTLPTVSEFHTGWLEEDGRRYYFNEEGVMQTGWLELEGKTYYFCPDGAMARGAVEIDGQLRHFAADGSPIVLVNPWTFLPEDYEPELVEAENGYLVERSCHADLMQMLGDCRTAGFDARICSAYRDNDLQVYLYNRKVEYYLNLGYNDADARKEAGTVVAAPGTSEHQLGLAVDLVDINNWNLDESQEDMPAQKWLMENSWRYGFILRYPNEKSEQTGIIYEPWHYRYVGHTVAKELFDSGLCLEEYLENLTQ